MLDRIVADRAQFQRLFDSPVDVRHPEALKEPQNLDVFAPALLAHARFQQPVQGGKLPWQVPALQRCRLVQRANLLFQQRQEVHRIEDHISLLTGPLVAGDHLGAAADDDLVDIAADLNLVMSAGDRNRVIVVAIADHRDRRRPRAEPPHVPLCRWTLCWKIKKSRLLPICKYGSVGHVPFAFYMGIVYLCL